MDLSALYIGSDHAGFELKQNLLEKIKILFPKLKMMDCGTHSFDSADYPLIAEKVAHQVVQAPHSAGILICGTGIGMSIAANKVLGVRAACVWSEETAKLSREHNDSNILCLGARLTSLDEAVQRTSIWLNTSFLGGRHLKRVEQIQKLEEKK